MEYIRGTNRATAKTISQTTGLGRPAVTDKMKRGAPNACVVSIRPHFIMKRVCAAMVEDD